MRDEPVGALQGPRAVGKTTLLREIAAAQGTDTIDLDDLATRDAVAADPATFVSGTAPVCIDEYQHVPLVLDAARRSRVHAGAATTSRCASNARLPNSPASSRGPRCPRCLQDSPPRPAKCLLEALFLIHRLPAWGPTLRARAAAMPKLHVIDSGLAAHLLRLRTHRLGQRNPTALQQFGHLLETFVVGETLKQVSWMDGVAGVGHWRTHEGAEVDLVIERDDRSADQA